MMLCIQRFGMKCLDQSPLEIPLLTLNQMVVRWAGEWNWSNPQVIRFLSQTTRNVTLITQDLHVVLYNHHTCNNHLSSSQNCGEQNAEITQRQVQFSCIHTSSFFSFFCTISVGHGISVPRENIFCCHYGIMHKISPSCSGKYQQIPEISDIGNSRARRYFFANYWSSLFPWSWIVFSCSFNTGVHMSWLSSRSEPI